MEIPRLTPLTYDVFVSFYGDDTRKSFTSHLLTALEQHGIHTFRDDEKLKRGERIGDELEKAIEQSRVSLVVLSQNYAKSRWCLNELVKIMDCKKKFGQIVFPIFHGVAPSEVRMQKRRFAEAFSEHAKHGGVERWKEALTNVAHLSGWDLPKVANGDEAHLVQKVVKEVHHKLDIVLHVASYEIGLESRLGELEEKLKMEADDVRIVAICGMGGIGKTTIAKKLYNVIQHKFEGSGFVANIREISKQPNGLVILQEQLLSDILGSGTHGIRNFHQGIEVIKRRALSRKVLLILDDVDNVEQLNALAINRDSFRFGSRIVITTRVRNLPAVDEVYEAKGLDMHESFQLFSRQCFKKDRPTDDHLELSNQVVRYAGGLPLAIEVLGAHFRGKSMGECESQIVQLREVPHDDVQTKLKISYDSLNDEVKELFLDVACFFVGTNRDFTVKMLKACNSITEAGFRVLTDRCLIKYDADIIGMHDLIRDMGRVIVRERGRFPGDRSRLWCHEDALEVLGNGTGIEAVEGLFLNFHEPNEVQVNSKAFEKMNRLWLLHLNYVHVKEGYDSCEHISRRIMWLCWNGFPLSCLPSNVHMENLVSLDLRYSSLKKAWKGTKIMVKLKFLYLSHCYQLVETPNFSGLNNLKELFLNDCTSLMKVSESIRHLNKLLVLNMKNCKKLQKLPSSIWTLKSLESLDLSGCSMLRNFLGFKESLSKYQFSSWIFKTIGAESIGLSPSHVLGLGWLKELRMQNCNLSYLPNEVENLISLETLDLSEINLRTLPDRIWNLTRLKELKMINCNLSHLPNEVENLISLKCLSLGHNNLHTLPDSICNLTGLKDLILWDCNLSHLPSEFGRLILLEWLDVSQNNLLTLPDSFCNLACLEVLGLNFCKLSHLPDRFGMLSSLQTLCLTNNNICSLPPSCSDLASLHTLVVPRCSRLQSLPQLPNLQDLFAYNCASLESIPIEFNCQAGLRMNLDGCNILDKNNLANNLMQGIGHSLSELSEQESSQCNDGLFDIFLPGDEVPSSFKYHSTGSRLSLEVPRRIRGWILCVVLTINVIGGSISLDLPIFFYKPTPFSLRNTISHHRSSAGVHRLFLYVRSDSRGIYFKGQYVDPRGICRGDQLEIAINPDDLPGFSVKMFGINLIYEGDEDDTEMLIRKKRKLQRK